VSSYDPIKLRAELTRDEARRTSPYLDCCGQSWRLCTCTSKGHLTIGVGWNLDANPLPEWVVDLLLDLSIGKAERGLDAIEPQWRDLNDERQRVLMNMCFNLGAAGLASLTSFWAHIRDYFSNGHEASLDKAADRMLAFKWAAQVGPRAQRLAALMRPNRG